MKFKHVTKDYFFSGEHKFCEDNTVTTKSGTFTFHSNTYLSRDGAKDFCENKGELLAPITTWDDFYKLRNFTDGCTNLGGSSMYRIGLDVVDDRNRYFTNGEAFNKSVHEPLYSSIESINTKPTCWDTWFYSYPGIHSLDIEKNIHCLYWSHPFICLKPAVNTPVCN